MNRIAYTLIMTTEFYVLTNHIRHNAA